MSSILSQTKESAKTSNITQSREALINHTIVPSREYRYGAWLDMKLQATVTGLQKQKLIGITYRQN